MSAPSSGDAGRQTFSWPAVSQIWNLYVVPSTTSALLTYAAPIVLAVDSVNLSEANLRTSDDLPTATGCRTATESAHLPLPQRERS